MIITLKLLYSFQLIPTSWKFLKIVQFQTSDPPSSGGSVAIKGPPDPDFAYILIVCFGESIAMLIDPTDGTPDERLKSLHSQGPLTVAGWRS